MLKEDYCSEKLLGLLYDTEFRNVVQDNVSQWLSRDEFIHLEIPQSLVLKWFRLTYDILIFARQDFTKSSGFYYPCLLSKKLSQGELNLSGTLWFLYDKAVEDGIIYAVNNLIKS